MLTKVDRMSMEHALEVRTPFLDFEVVELAFQMPADFKIQPGSQKKILRDTFQYLLPESVFSRKKMGFEIPVERWLPGTIQPMLLDLLRTHSSEASRIFDVSHIEKMTKQDFRGVSNGPARAWGLLIALYWLQNDTP
jgi:asparagine synthase (glutamine-hydrolysing)